MDVCAVVTRVRNRAHTSHQARLPQVSPTCMVPAVCVRPALCLARSRTPHPDNHILIQKLDTPVYPRAGGENGGHQDGSFPNEKLGTLSLQKIRQSNPVREINARSRPLAIHTLTRPFSSPISDRKASNWFFFFRVGWAGTPSPQYQSVLFFFGLVLRSQIGAENGRVRVCIARGSGPGVDRSRCV